MKPSIIAIAILALTGCTPENDSAERLKAKELANDLDIRYWFFLAPEDISSDEKIAIAYRFWGGAEERIFETDSWKPGEEARVYFWKTEDEKNRIRLVRDNISMIRVLQNPIFDTKPSIMFMSIASKINTDQIFIKIGERETSFDQSNELQFGQVGVFLQRDKANQAAHTTPGSAPRWPARMAFTMGE